MPNVLTLMPQLEGEEAMYIQHLISGMTEEQAMQFSFIYKERRKDPQMILLLSVLGFVPGIAGIQRFVVDQIGMGILYLLTLGFCYVGTIIDMVNYKRIAWEYNRTKAEELAHISGHRPQNIRM